MYYSYNILFIRYIIHIIYRWNNLKVYIKNQIINIDIYIQNNSHNSAMSIIAVDYSGLQLVAQNLIFLDNFFIFQLF
jgi:hypothetical protein